MGKPREEGPDQHEDGVEVQERRDRRLTDNLETVEDLIAKLEVGQRIIMPKSKTDQTQQLARVKSLPTGDAGLIELSFRPRTKHGIKPIKNPTITAAEFLRLVKIGEIRIPLSKERAEELAGFTSEDVNVQGKPDIRRRKDLGRTEHLLRQEIRKRFPQFLKDA